MPANEKNNRGPLRRAQDRHAPLLQIQTAVSKPRIARFLLAAHCKNQNGLNLDNVTIQSHIAVRTAPDHQLSLVIIRGATNHGIVLQHV